MNCSNSKCHIFLNVCTLDMSKDVQSVGEHCQLLHSVDQLWIGRVSTYFTWTQLGPSSSLPPSLPPSLLPSLSLLSHIMFWDMRPPVQKRLNQPPKPQATTKKDNPYHYLDLTWKPFLKVSS